MFAGPASQRLRYETLPLTMTPSSLRRASIVLGVLGGVGQLGVAFMGFAIGGPSAVVVLLAVDGLIAVAGAVVVSKVPMLGLILLLVAGAGAVVALFSTTLLEIGVIVLLVGSAATAAPLLRTNTHLSGTQE
jgi:hypothetical protein